MGKLFNDSEMHLDQEVQFDYEGEAYCWQGHYEVKQYGEEPDLSTSANYDYRQAWRMGIRPERDPYDSNRFHWASSTPDGTMLKSKTHPTAWKEEYMRATGSNPDAVGATQADWLKMQGQ